MGKHFTLHLDAAPAVDGKVWFSEADAVKLAGGYFEHMAKWMKGYMRKHGQDAVAYICERRPGMGIGWGRDAKGRLRVIEIYWPASEAA